MHDKTIMDAVQKLLSICMLSQYITPGYPKKYMITGKEIVIAKETIVVMTVRVVTTPYQQSTSHNKRDNPLSPGNKHAIHKLWSCLLPYHCHIRNLGTKEQR